MTNKVRFVRWLDPDYQVNKDFTFRTGEVYRYYNEEIHRQFSDEFIRTTDLELFLADGIMQEII